MAHHQAAEVRLTGDGSLARRPSGVIVPAELANTPDPKAAIGGSVSRDMDGRRRVVYSDTDRRAIDKAINLLVSRGLGYLMGCVGIHRKPGTPAVHEDGSPACGQMLKVEDAGTPDAGYGCQCTRVHFERGLPNARR